MGDRQQTSPQSTSPVSTISDRTKTIAQYTLGQPRKPSNIDHSRPSPDQYRLHPAAASDYAQLAKWKVYLEGVKHAQGVPYAPHNNIPEGIAAYEHYLYGNGADRWFSYEKYVRQDAAGQQTLRSAIRDASSGAEKLYFENFYEKQRAAQAAGRKADPVRYSFTGSGLGAGNIGNAVMNERFPYPETEDWQKTIGSHFIWLSGNVTVTLDSNGKPEFELDLTLHAEDKYQYVSNLQDIASLIKDDENVRLETAGLAKPYMHYSYLTRTVKWAANPTLAVGPVSASAPSSLPPPALPQPPQRVPSVLMR